jgi:gamma-glutamyltranspeptidase
MAIKETGLKFRESRLLVQALRALGKEHITPEIIHTLSETMKNVSADKILQDTQQVSVWIYEVIEQILKG